MDRETKSPAEAGSGNDPGWRAIWVVFSCFLIALGVVGLKAFLLSESAEIQRDARPAFGLAVLIASVLSGAVIETTGMRKRLLTGVRRIRLRMPFEVVSSGFAPGTQGFYVVPDGPGVKKTPATYEGTQPVPNRTEAVAHVLTVHTPDHGAERRTVTWISPHPINQEAAFEPLSAFIQEHEAKLKGASPTIDLSGTQFHNSTVQ